jgi:hypothetical protein
MTGFGGPIFLQASVAGLFYRLRWLGFSTGFGGRVFLQALVVGLFYKMNGFPMNSCSIMNMAIQLRAAGR